MDRKRGKGRTENRVVTRGEEEEVEDGEERMMERKRKKRSTE